MAKILGRVCGIIFGIMIAVAFLNALHQYGEFFERMNRVMDQLEKVQ